MKKTGLIMEDVRKAFGSRYTEIKHHPYHRDWLEVIIKKGYLSSEDTKNIIETCEKHNLDFHAAPNGRLFKKLILCIYDKNPEQR